MGAYVIPGAHTPERVAGFLGVGLLLLLGSAVYIRSSARPGRAESAESDSHAESAENAE